VEHALELAAALGSPDVERLLEGVRLLAPHVERDRQIALSCRRQLLGEDLALHLAR